MRNQTSGLSPFGRASSIATLLAVSFFGAHSANAKDPEAPVARGVLNNPDPKFPSTRELALEQAFASDPALKKMAENLLARAERDEREAPWDNQAKREEMIRFNELGTGVVEGEVSPNDFVRNVENKALLDAKSRLYSGEGNLSQFIDSNPELFEMLGAGKASGKVMPFVKFGVMQLDSDAATEMSQAREKLKTAMTAAELAKKLDTKLGTDGWVKEHYVKTGLQDFLGIKTTDPSEKIRREKPSVAEAEDRRKELLEDRARIEKLSDQVNELKRQINSGKVEVLDALKKAQAELLANQKKAEERVTAVLNSGFAKLQEGMDELVAWRREVKAQEEARRKIAEFNTITGAVSDVFGLISPELRKTFDSVLSFSVKLSAINFSEFALVDASSLISAGISLFATLFGSPPRDLKFEATMKALEQLSKGLEQIHRNMNERFDRVDARLDSLLRYAASNRADNFQTHLGIERLQWDVGAVAFQLRALDRFTRAFAHSNWVDSVEKQESDFIFSVTQASEHLTDRSQEWIDRFREFGLDKAGSSVATGRAWAAETLTQPGLLAYLLRSRGSAYSVAMVQEQVENLLVSRRMDASSISAPNLLNPEIFFLANKALLELSEAWPKDWSHPRKELIEQLIQAAKNNLSFYQTLASKGVLDVLVDQYEKQNSSLRQLLELRFNSPQFKYRAAIPSMVDLTQGMSQFDPPFLGEKALPYSPGTKFRPLTENQVEDAKQLIGEFYAGRPGQWTVDQVPGIGTALDAKFANELFAIHREHLARLALGSNVLNPEKMKPGEVNGSPVADLKLSEPTIRLIPYPRGIESAENIFARRVKIGTETKFGREDREVDKFDDAWYHPKRLRVGFDYLLEVGKLEGATQLSEGYESSFIVFEPQQDLYLARRMDHHHGQKFGEWESLKEFNSAEIEPGIKKTTELWESEYKGIVEKASRYVMSFMQVLVAAQREGREFYFELPVGEGTGGTRYARKDMNGPIDRSKLLPPVKVELSKIDLTEVKGVKVHVSKGTLVSFNLLLKRSWKYGDPEVPEYGIGINSKDPTQPEGIPARLPYDGMANLVSFGKSKGILAAEVLPDGKMFPIGISDTQAFSLLIGIKGSKPNASGLSPSQVRLAQLGTKAIEVMQNDLEKDEEIATALRGIEDLKALIEATLVLSAKQQVRSSQDMLALYGLRKGLIGMNTIQSMLEEAKQSGRVDEFLQSLDTRIKESKILLERALNGLTQAAQSPNFAGFGPASMRDSLRALQEYLKVLEDGK